MGGLKKKPEVVVDPGHDLPEFWAAMVDKGLRHSQHDLFRHRGRAGSEESLFHGQGPSACVRQPGLRSFE